MIRLFRVFIPTSVLALLVSEVILIFSCYVLASVLLVDVDPQVFLFDDGGWLRIAIVVGSVMLGLYFHDLYTQFRIKSRLLLLEQVVLVVGMAFLAQAALIYVRRPDLTLSIRMMIGGSAVAMVVLPAWRMLYSSVVVKALGSQRVLFLGTSPAAQEIAEEFSYHPELGFLALGYIGENAEAASEDLVGGSVVGGIPDLRDVVERLKPDRIVVGMSERRNRLPVQELLELRFSGIHIEDAQTMYESTFGRVCTRELRPSQLIFSTELGPRANRVMWQTIYSIALAGIGAVITLPIMALVALAVKMTSKGPVMYRQKRVGLDGAPFTVLKFRSMYADAEARTGAVWATRDDPRITPLGKWLRKLRLDELPQLFNVLRGEMTIVGPRPERPEFVQTLIEQIPYYRQRLCVKPGITGWAQINYKYGDTLQDTIRKLEYDLYYIKNLAPTLDFYIMFGTVKVMVLSRGSQ